MPRCTRKGCGKEYEVAENTDESCSYHSGSPVFHEGLKSWSCCEDVNKPVLDFDDFMKIPGCTSGPHTDEAVKIEAPKPTSPNVNLKMTGTEAGKETYSTKPAVTPTLSTSAPAEPVPPPEEEEDDLSVPVAPGKICLRKGCGKAFVSDEVSRTEGGSESICYYHPLPPIFREGSKGYLCCKRRVLEFDEFMKIGGCKQGRHLFVPKKKADEPSEEFVDCRIDHYQTPTGVHVSVFAKKAEPDKSTVKIGSDYLDFDILLPGPKRFRRTIPLFGPIIPAQSSYKYFGTKIELTLKKEDARSWTLLEKTDKDLGGISLTFGVGGRTGTVGGKDIILDPSNANRAQAS
ncbi:chord-domain-containing protein [Abortiporus biennis]|nr:chord-domain-containing protein [Abortiporus biennis]